VIALRDVQIDDLPLILAWRNHPLVYEGFYEQGYLGKGLITWEEHCCFWAKHLNSETYKAWVICYENRNVGVVWKLENEIGIYVGEVTLHRKGIGKQVLSLLAGTFNRTANAKILKSNFKSMRLFESCGFKRAGEAREGEWLYELG